MVKYSSARILKMHLACVQDNQEIIDSTGTETQRTFSCMLVTAYFFKQLLPST